MSFKWVSCIVSLTTNSLEINKKKTAFNRDSKSLNRETERSAETDKQTNRQTDRQADRQTDRQTNRQICLKPGFKFFEQGNREIGRNRQADRQTERQINLPLTRIQGL